MSAVAIYLLSLLAALLLQSVALPDLLSMARPSWPLLVLAYWALYVPEAPTLLSAFLLGLCCDVLFDAPLGAHALALVLAIAVVIRLRGVYVLFPIWQAAMMLIPVWALFSFSMFWIDGLTHHDASPMLRWLPVASTTIVWPLFAHLFDGLRARRAREANRMRLP